MYRPVALPSSAAPQESYPGDDWSVLNGAGVLPDHERQSGILHGILRRWCRERRRRKVGRAYDMALEIARMLPGGLRVLDVGCGNGYIAHHLASLLRADVAGIDLEYKTESAISYQQYNGGRFPIKDESFDAVLLCYVLHHTQNITIVLTELRRVLRNGGLAVVYEDVPETSWDRFVCALHDHRWRHRTGPCTFRSEEEWREVFGSAGFEIVKERRLSRWRNVAYPVARRCYLVKIKG